MRFFRKASPRRNQLRKNITAERLSQIRQLINPAVIISALLWLLFVVLCTLVFSFELILQGRYLALIPTAVIVVLISLAVAAYINHYQGRIIKNHTRALALVGIFILLLATAKFGTLLANQTSWATGAAITAAIILTLAYDQRFAIGMSIFYCLFTCFAAKPLTDINLFLTMNTGAIICCFLLKEIRTRMKLLEVSTFAAVMVFITTLVLGFLDQNSKLTDIFTSAGWHAVATLIAGLLIQSLLPLIEKTFHIATSMTLLDHSDANHPLLKRLAMEAPGGASWPYCAQPLLSLWELFR